jgi:1-acylglycerone phosphate reductase
VFATARSLESMSNLSENGIETFALDVTVSERIVSLKEEITKRTGGTLDYLYNNARESKSLGSMQKIAGLHAFVLS